MGCRLWCVLVGITVAACSIKDVDYTGKACPCASGYSCDSASNTCVLGDAGTRDGIDTPPGESCYGTGAAVVCLRDPPAQDMLQPANDLVVDTDSSPNCQTVDGTNVANACVLVANTIHIGNGIKLSAHGSRPLVVLGVKLIDIGGTFDVAAHRVGLGTGTPTAPPGANPLPLCAITTLAGIGGGAGGSFGAMGGHGGTGNANVGQAPLAAAPAIVPLRGGCNGGDGGATGNSGAGGVGGGAVYFISGTSIIVMGTIDASGEGGRGAKTTSAGGGGGGAGGLVAFDAPSVSVTGNVFANGGGGSSGSSDTVDGGDGGDPASPGTIAAVGGAGDMSGNRKGGAGSAGASKPGGGGANSNSTGGGGGGGGAAGVIHVYPSQNLIGNVSPPAS